MDYSPRCAFMHGVLVGALSIGVLFLSHNASAAALEKPGQNAAQLAYVARSTCPRGAGRQLYDCTLSLAYRWLEAAGKMRSEDAGTTRFSHVDGATAQAFTRRIYVLVRAGDGA